MDCCLRGQESIILAWRFFKDVVFIRKVLKYSITLSLFPPAANMDLASNITKRVFTGLHSRASATNASSSIQYWNRNAKKVLRGIYMYIYFFLYLIYLGHTMTEQKSKWNHHITTPTLLRWRKYTTKLSFWEARDSTIHYTNKKHRKVRSETRWLFCKNWRKTRRANLKLTEAVDRPGKM